MQLTFTFIVSKNMVLTKGYEFESQGLAVTCHLLCISGIIIFFDWSQDKTILKSSSITDADQSCIL